MFQKIVIMVQTNMKGSSAQLKFYALMKRDAGICYTAHGLCQKNLVFLAILDRHAESKAHQEGRRENEKLHFEIKDNVGKIKNVSPHFEGTLASSANGTAGVTVIDQILEAT